MAKIKRASLQTFDEARTAKVVVDTLIKMGTFVPLELVESCMHEMRSIIFQRLENLPDRIILKIQPEDKALIHRLCLETIDDIRSEISAEKISVRKMAKGRKGAFAGDAFSDLISAIRSDTDARAGATASDQPRRGASRSMEEADDVK